MPTSGAKPRGQQLSVLARTIHAKKTDPELGVLLDDLCSNIDAEELSEMELAGVREAHRDFQRAVRMPAELEAEAAALGSEGFVAWQKARENSDFSQFESSMGQWVELQQKMAAAVEPQLDPYDYCLDKYERGMTSARLDPVFSKLKGNLVDLLRRITASDKFHVDKGFLESRDLFSGQFSLETQTRLARRLAEEIGFSFDGGRLDESTHPFTVGVASPWDVRITTRFNESDLASGIRATLHEAGHGLYEQGRCPTALPAASRPPSMGMHESQSLFWERMVGMSEAYWEHYWPAMLRSFSSLKRSKAEDYYRVINEVQSPSLIRVEADEVSYPLHILLRYEIERGLLNGTVQVSDVPDLWNSKMEQYLGVVPPSHAQGCLQDIHWSAGLFGYFPTYTIGALYACQLYETVERDIPEAKDEIRSGRFGRIREWLRSEVHEKGSLHPTADELVEKVTGRRLDADGFISYLEKKYGALYEL